MGIAVPTGDTAKTEQSLALMIRAQFTEYDVYNVIGHTEIPSRHIPPMVTLLTLQRIEEILSTPEPDESLFGDTIEAQEAFEQELEKFELNCRIRLSDDAMIATILYGWTFFYGLCMRSRDRKIRLEGLQLGRSSIIRDEMTKQQMGGLPAKIASAAGLSKLTKRSNIY